ncbi:MAG: archaellin/type IV pilin N-terminal domain-containing protein [Candidatus Pacearchaeota archaeon]
MKKGDLKFKKGLSPVIATVLLIVLVFVLFALIFLWMRGLISEQIEKNEQAIENVCPSVTFQADLVREGSNYFIEVINRGSVHIHRLEVKLIDSQGDSEIYSFNEADVLMVGVGETLKKDIDLTMDSGDTATEIIVYPIIAGTVKGGSTNKPYTCIDMGQTINVI